MLMFVALGVMGVIWMSVIAIIVLAQKLLPPKATIDVPVGLAIVGGILIVIAPSLVPRLQPMESQCECEAGRANDGKERIP